MSDFDQLPARLEAADPEGVRAAGELVRSEAERLARSDPRRLNELMATLHQACEVKPAFDRWACWAEGIGEHLRGRPSAATPLLERASARFRRSGDEHTAARVDITLMDALACLGRHRAAVRRGRRAVATFTAAGDRVHQASALINLGGLADARDQVRAAVRLWRRARGLLPTTGLVRRASLDGSLASALQGLGRFRSATRLYISAAELYGRAGATRTALKAELGLAETRAMLGDLGESLAATRRAEAAAKEYEDDDLLFEARLLMARLELELGHVERAAAIADDTFDRCREAGRLGDAARLAVLRTLAVARGAAGDLQSAVKVAEEALQCAGLKVAAAAMRVELARAGQDLTPDRLRRDVAVLERAGLRVQADLARLVQAESLAAEGRHPQTLGLCRKVLDHRHASVWPRIEAHAVVANLLAESEPETAIRHLRRAVGIAESIRGRLACEADRTAFMARVGASYELLVGLLLRRGNARSRRQAFDLVARVKSRALLEALDRRRDLDWRTSPEVVRQWNAMRSELAAMLGVLETRQDHHTRYSRSIVENRVRSLSRRLEELEVEITRCDPRLGAVLGRADDTPLRPLLRPGEALLEMYLAGSDLVLFDLRRAGLKVTRVVGVRRQLERRVEALRFQLSKAAYGRSLLEKPGAVLVGQARSQLAALGEMILGPLYRRSRPAVLFVAPHGALHHIPFAALELGGEPAVARYPVAVTPSSRVLARILERSPRPPKRLGVAGASPVTLPEIEAEVEAIARRFPDSETASEARTEDVQRLLATCDAVHIASHGAFQPLFPAGSGIRLADGWLTAMDLLRLEIRARFVSVGSCASGQVAVTPGEELMGMVRALLEGGADTAVLAPGALDDRIARSAAQLIFENLLAHGPGEALRRALLTLREEHPHPALWAAFQLYGNPRAWESRS